MPISDKIKKQWEKKRRLIDPKCERVYQLYKRDAVLNKTLKREGVDQRSFLSYLERNNLIK